MDQNNGFNQNNDYNQNNGFNQNNDYNQNNSFNQPINQINPQQNFQQPVVQQPVMNSQENTSKPEEKNNKTKFYIIGILLFVVVFILGLFLGKLVYSKNNTIDNINNNTNNTDNISNDNTVDSDIIGDENGDLLFEIESVFTISGRGTVVSGKVLRGTIKTGDKVQILGLNKEAREVEVGDIEIYRKQADKVSVGEKPGLILKNISRDDILEGQILVKPNSVKTYKKCDVSVEMYNESDVGENVTINDTDKQLFHFWTADIYGNISFSNGVQTLSSGQNSNATITLTADTVMEIGTKFYIKKDDKVVGKGTVTKLY